MYCCIVTTYDKCMALRFILWESYTLGGKGNVVIQGNIVIEGTKRQRLSLANTPNRPFKCFIITIMLCWDSQANVQIDTTYLDHKELVFWLYDKETDLCIEKLSLSDIFSLYRDLNLKSWPKLGGWNLYVLEEVKWQSKMRSLKCHRHRVKLARNLFQCKRI